MSRPGACTACRGTQRRRATLASSQWFCTRGTPSRSRFRNRISDFALGGGVGAMLKPFHLRWIAVWLLRVALAFSFLSAVADRFGLWGQFGSGVAWGDFERFTAYTAQLLWFL